jgi:PAS domain-containing protein
MAPFAMSAPKPIQLILARQLASSLAVPILLVDTEGTLVFYNEPAELILDQRFDETGEIPADTWSKLFAVEDEERKPIAQEDRPTMLALSERQAVLAHGVDALRPSRVVAREHHRLSLDRRGTAVPRRADDLLGG